ncbi:Cleavage stimulating factor 64 [Linum grandiflorum]
MAGKTNPADVLAADFAGMTKSQLYDIMSQMKTLIEQNRQQAREILIQNPPLTKALFQAQIMLGMVQPPPVIPAIQPTVSQQPPQPAPPPQASNVPKPQPLQGQPAASQGLHQNRKHHQNQPAVPISSSVPPVNLPSQSAPIHTLPTSHLPKGHLNSQVTAMQTSQIPSMPPQPHQPPQLPASQLQPPPLKTSGISHLPPQPPMPTQPRPPHSMPGFHNQYQQMGSNAGFQHGGSHQHPSQSMFHSGNRAQHPGPSYPQGQQPVPTQPPPQSLYQGGGSHLTSDFNQGASSMQVDRGSSSWLPGPPDSSTIGQAPANQPARSAPLTPDMEKALLQQVMSLTPEQINLLPQEQRNQVLQLQQMLRQ